MNNSLKLVTVAIVSAIIGSVTSSFALSGIPGTFKVAVVDVPKVVSSSKQVSSLKQEQKQKVAEMTAFVKTAKTNIANEKDPAKKKALEASYTKTLDAKKAAIEKDYAVKLRVIDNNISTLIQAKAKEGNYNLVLSKGIVLAGGEDITAKIIAAVK